MKSKLSHFLALGGLLTVAMAAMGCNSHKYTIISKHYRIVANTSEDLSYAHLLNEALEAKAKFKLPIVDASDTVDPLEIVIDDRREEVQELTDDLAEEGYGIKEDNGKIIIGYKTPLARICAIDHLLAEFSANNSIRIPMNTYVRGTCKFDDKVTLPSLPDYEGLFDPYIIKVEEQARDAYYLYGTPTGEDGYGFGDWYMYEASDSLKGEWIKHENIVPYTIDDLDEKEPCRYSPKVYRYKGEYYMFTSYKSKATEHYGVTVFKSASPVGPFEPCSSHPDNNPQPEKGDENYHITSDKVQKDTFDGTLYVDPTGQPWLVYIDDYFGNDDFISKFSAAKLSDDLSHIISEPIDLFKPSAATWAGEDAYYMEGGYIHTLSSGKLVMLWSGYTVKEDRDYEYVTGYATADSITGKWEQHDRLLFSADMLVPNAYEYGYDGGHSMIYEDNGQLYMAQYLYDYYYKTPMPVVVPVKETPDGNSLVWNLYTKKK